MASVTAAFLVVGVAWSTNHIVSNSQARWAEIYVDGFSSLAADAYLQLVLRVTVWTTAAVASWAVLIRWQLDKAIHASEMLVVPRLLPALAAVAATAAAAVLLLTSDGTSDVSWKPVTFWVVLGAAGLVGQLWSWWGDQQWLLRGSWLAWVLAGSLLREWLRLQTLDVERFQARHADAWQVGGLGVFLAATLLCGALAAWCLHIVRSATSAS